MILVGTKLLVSDSAKNAMKNRKKHSIVASLLLKLIYKEVVGSTCFSGMRRNTIDVFNRHLSRQLLLVLVVGVRVSMWWWLGAKIQSRKSRKSLLPLSRVERLPSAKVRRQRMQVRGELGRQEPLVRNANARDPIATLRFLNSPI